jgi:shikimate kinase
MIDTKLILVEGLPGSGKSSFGQFVGLQLSRNNHNAQWFIECELNHPVQFEYEASFSDDDFSDLIEKHKPFSTLLENSVIKERAPIENILQYQTS